MGGPRLQADAVESAVAVVLMLELAERLYAIREWKRGSGIVRAETTGFCAVQPFGKAKRHMWLEPAYMLQLQLVAVF
jgi:hypothetical protein